MQYIDIDIIIVEQRETSSAARRLALRDLWSWQCWPPCPPKREAVESFVCLCVCVSVCLCVAHYHIWSSRPYLGPGPSACTWTKWRTDSSELTVWKSLLSDLTITKSRSESFVGRENSLRCYSFTGNETMRVTKEQNKRRVVLCWHFKS